MGVCLRCAQWLTLICFALFCCVTLWLCAVRLPAVHEGPVPDAEPVSTVFPLSCILLAHCLPKVCSWPDECWCALLCVLQELLRMAAVRIRASTLLPVTAICALCCCMLQTRLQRVPPGAVPVRSQDHPRLDVHGELRFLPFCLGCFRGVSCSLHLISFKLLMQRTAWTSFVVRSSLAT
jgi:hypothetical protein